MGDSVPQAAPGAAAGSSGAGPSRTDAGAQAEPPDAPEQPENDELADESEAESLVHAESDEDAASEQSTTEPPAAPAATGKAKGGRGKGRGRGNGRGRGAAAEAAPGAAPPAAGKQPKYTWVDVDNHTFLPRTPWAGADEAPTLGPEYNHLTVDSPPEEWFVMRDAPEAEYHDRAANSDGYRSWRHTRMALTASRRTARTRSATTARRTSRTRTCATTTHTTSSSASTPPCRARRTTTAIGSPSSHGHRSADIFNLQRVQFIRKFHHPADPSKRVPKGQQGYDNLYQVLPMLKSFQKDCRSKKLVNGKKKSTDEETVAFHTVAIFDKKGFQMIDTYHRGVEVTTKERKVFDRVAGKPGKKSIPITKTQHVYNNTMGYVDLDDLLAWFYRCARW